jgi:outer membrane protein TolC
MFKPILLWSLLWAVMPAISSAQQTLTLDSCYLLARKNYPLIAQQDLITRSRDALIDNLSTGRLPQLTLYGRASYQSDVTHVPIHLPDAVVPELSKDQYRVYGELAQRVYDGAELRKQQQLAASQARVQQQSLEMQLYQIRQRINQLFFGILLMDARRQENTLLKRDIQLGLQQVRAALAGGAALASNVDLLQAELLTADEQQVELRAASHAFRRMLGLFIHRPVSDSMVLIAPSKLSVVRTVITRPELEWFADRQALEDSRDQLLGASVLPKVHLFLQGGYGRPGLDMLDNHFTGYYIGGVELSVPLSALYTLKRKRELVHLSQEKIQTEQETFLFNTRVTLQKQEEDIAKLNRLLVADNDIIALREKVVDAAVVQLRNGVVTASDFLKQVNAADQARQRKALHQIQLLQTQYDKRFTLGDQPNTF